MAHQSPFDVILAQMSLQPQVRGSGATAAGTGIDMQGWDGIAFLVTHGTSDAASVALSTQESTDNSTWAASSVTATITALAGTAAETSILDLYKPTNRYVRPLLTIGTATTGTLVSVTAFQYRRTGRAPVTQVVSQLAKFVEN